jgi:hypothetical protein
LSEVIKINNIFINPTEYESNVVEIGNTRRTPSGHMYNQNLAKYKTFELQIEGVSPSMHSNLLYLVNLNRSYDSNSENLTLNDFDGSAYEVAIPVDGYTFYQEKGKKESYYWEVSFEEVSG